MEVEAPPKTHHLIHHRHQRKPTTQYVITALIRSRFTEGVKTDKKANILFTLDVQKLETLSA